MIQCFVGVGSNIDRRHNIQSVLQILGHDYPELRASTIYETGSAGFDASPFYNLVVTFPVRQTVESLQQYLASIELQHGRGAEHQGFRSRPLDLDLLLYGDLVRDDEVVCVPSKDILHYEFVLWPLVELAPDLVHPLSARSLGQHWQEMENKSVLLTRVVL